MNVLNSYAEWQGETGFTVLAIVFALMVLVVTLLKDDIERWCHLYLSKDNFFFKHAKMVWLYIVLVLVLVYGLGGASLMGTDNYIEAIISDDYPLKALYEDYEIVERRGEIWVLREREKEPETKIISEGKEVTEDDG